jgi:hypothetical protein
MGESSALTADSELTQSDDLRGYWKCEVLLYLSGNPTYRELTAWPERIIDYPAALTAAVLRDMIINCYGVRGRSPFPAVLDPRRETKGSLFGGRYCSLKKRPHFLLDCEGESSFPLFSSSS